MKIAILGASRGLGASLVRVIQQENPPVELLLVSRKLPLLQALARSQDRVLSADFSKDDGQRRVLSELSEFDPQQIFYVAGGGPHGVFEEKNWTDHTWALEVGLIFPMRVVHEALRRRVITRNLQKLVLVGSAIAGRQPDPKASSYAAAKHGLRGLVTSIQGESPGLDIRIYEPGYIATEMLPADAWPRQQGLASDPAEEARQLWHWSQR
jgi:short-subunit dehydrogenase